MLIFFEREMRRMKKSIIAALVMTALLCGCGQTDSASSSKAEKTTSASTTSTSETTTATATGTGSDAAATTKADTETTKAASNGTGSDYLGSDAFWKKVDSGEPLTQEEWDYLVTTDKYQQDMAMQSAGYKVLDFVGTGYKIVSHELTQSDNGEYNVYRIGYTKADGSDPTVYYYCVLGDGAYPDGAVPDDVKQKKDEEWNKLVESDEFKESMAEQNAGYNALERAGEGYMIVSSEKVSDANNGTYYRVGVKKSDGSDSTVTYYMVSDFFCVLESDWQN